MDLSGKSSLPARWQTVATPEPLQHWTGVRLLGPWAAHRIHDTNAPISSDDLYARYTYLVLLRRCKDQRGRRGCRQQGCTIGVNIRTLGVDLLWPSWRAVLYGGKRDSHCAYTALVIGRVLGYGFFGQKPEVGLTCLNPGVRARCLCCRIHTTNSYQRTMPTKLTMLRCRKSQTKTGIK